jgi:hypothetical protein
MGKDFRIEKLADEFGQYILYLKCESCLHERRTTPNMLAKLCGWDANLSDVARRLRCSICGQKKCTARAVPDAAAQLQKPTDAPATSSASVAMRSHRQNGATMAT